jgi:putative protease
LQSNKNIEVELMAPAGDRQSLKAAVANGADAVYLGLPDFNARKRADNFTLDELPGVIEYLHNHNVKAYITLNTLVFSTELGHALEYIKTIAQSGADGVIVQDLGIAYLLSKAAPSLPVHASTQMTLTESEGIGLAEKLGIKRVILARELSLEQIKSIACKSCAELEVFVHGALCISYSGQCLASLTIAGRSANRGLCAQFCRMPYQLIVNGRIYDCGNRKYLLSPQDLSALEHIPKLIDCGVKAFKIEGRLKGEHYVAAATAIYRDAIDCAIQHKPFSISAEQNSQLFQGFSRGFTDGFLTGKNHQKLVEGKFSKNRGVSVGTVVGKKGYGVILEILPGESTCDNILKAGDGIVFDDGQQDEQGGRLYKVEQIAGNPRRLFITLGRDDVDLSKIAVNSLVWKTDDPAIRKTLQQSFARDIIHKTLPITLNVRAAAGENLQITASDTCGNCVSVQWGETLKPAEKHPLSIELIREQFGRLGGTPFELGEVKAEKLDNVMVPKSVLNDLRRQGVEALIEQRQAKSRHQFNGTAVLENIHSNIEARPAASTQGTLEAGVLVRTMKQFEAVMEWVKEKPANTVSIVYCDFADGSLNKDVLLRGRAAKLRVAAATLRIIKPGDEKSLEGIAGLKPDAVLVRNLAALAYFRKNMPDIELRGDYSLNIANEITAYVLAGWGLTKMSPSYDLNITQLSEMVSRSRPEWFEAVIHDHVPLFHTEHCIFAAGLSGGKDEKSCGKVCRNDKLELQDRNGVRHPVVHDIACRNTVFNGSVQSGAEFIPQLKAVGIKSFRINLLDEDFEQTIELLDCYRDTLAGITNCPDAQRQIADICRCRVTSGTFRKTSQIV